MDRYMEVCINREAKRQKIDAVQAMAKKAGCEQARVVLLKDRQKRGCAAKDNDTRYSAANESQRRRHHTAHGWASRGWVDEVVFSK